MAETRERAVVERETTMRTGPLGSTIHVLHADRQTVVELASIDWNRAFPLVYLDPIRGLITLMSPEDVGGGETPRRRPGTQGEEIGSRSAGTCRILQQPEFPHAQIG